MNSRDIFLILGLILIIAVSFYFQNINISFPPPIGDGTQTAYNNEGKTLGICDLACIDYCEKNPQIEFMEWQDITPQGSTKNCKIILEEELGIDDLSTCEECRCMCFAES